LTAIFQINVVLDREQIARDGARLGLSHPRAVETAVADVERRLFDAARHQPAVRRVGVELLTLPMCEVASR
jgi:hypothetical protein